MAVLTGFKELECCESNERLITTLNVKLPVGIMLSPLHRTTILLNITVDSNLKNLRQLDLCRNV